MSVSVIIDGSAIHKHEDLRRKFLVCSILCVAMDTCRKIVVATSRTEISSANILAEEIEDICSNIGELYNRVLEQYGDLAAQLFMNGIISLLMGIYGLARYRLDTICKNAVEVLVFEGVRKDRWREVVDEAFSTYLKRCIPEKMMDNSRFRDVLAGDFENWIKPAVDELCREHDIEAMVLTHDDGIETYVPDICSCYTKAIGCNLRIKVIKDKCEDDEVHLVLKMISIGD